MHVVGANALILFITFETFLLLCLSYPTWVGEENENLSLEGKLERKSSKRTISAIPSSLSYVLS